jgi:hypothetical protein
VLILFFLDALIKITKNNKLLASSFFFDTILPASVNMLVDIETDALDVLKLW